MKDTIEAEGKWQFNGDVTDAFDDMLTRSIPQYEVMRETVTRLAEHYVQPATAIVDLGCSRGEAMAPLVDKYGARCRFIGVDAAEPMAQAAARRFGSYASATCWNGVSPVVSIEHRDLREWYPPEPASVTLAVLTLQFTPIEYRPQIVQSIHDHLIEGGALLLVEKVLGATAALDAVMVAEYLESKRRAGYTEEQIARKKLALEGVLVPVTARWNEDLLQAAGFRQVDCFWRWQNFAGWIAVRS